MKFQSVATAIVASVTFLKAYSYEVADNTPVSLRGLDQHYEDNECGDLRNVQPILDIINEDFPFRAIQDLMPVPLLVNDGEVVWEKNINIGICKIKIYLEKVEIKAINFNWQSMHINATTDQRLEANLDVKFQMYGYIRGYCGIYKPQIHLGIELGEMLQLSVSACARKPKIFPNKEKLKDVITMTVNDITHYGTWEDMYWCIRNTLPVMEAALNEFLKSVRSDVYKGIREAIDDALPKVTQGMNELLREIGIKPYVPSEKRYGLIPYLAQEAPIFTRPALRHMEESLDNFHLESDSSIMSNTTLPKIKYHPTRTYKKIYDSDGDKGWRKLSFWEPQVENSTLKNYFPVGHVAIRSFSDPKRTTFMLHDDGSGVFAKPVRFERVFKDDYIGSSKKGSAWEPIPPPGYLHLGHVAMNSRDAVPNIDDHRVIREECALRCDPWMIYSARCTSQNQFVTVWENAQTIGIGLDHFVVTLSYDNPTTPGRFRCLNPKCLADFPTY